MHVCRYYVKNKIQGSNCCYSILYMLHRLHNSDDSDEEERAFNEEKKRKDVCVVINHLSYLITIVTILFRRSLYS